ncbi:hypothetical protein CR203_24040 [Salipaludibacillus neizhouensis]|uniref:Uncharacterized protein n=1 Tax=Salipaludibacillus neizhouensis TaxID=885475 RepID=A0A3A9K310_9BACI|nr:hypothetical protein [Salipaludibacillus neizhouensis]RKL64862.1 hypothetical protein CR203_24040 [Salipaludibacillus neizhouensis]
MKKKRGENVRGMCVGSERHEKKPEKTTGRSYLGLGKKSGKERVMGIPTQMFFTGDKRFLHSANVFYKDTAS